MTCLKTESSEHAKT